MTKQEAKASVKDIKSMVEYFYSVCPHCGVLRKDCKVDTCPDLISASSIDTLALIGDLK